MHYPQHSGFNILDVLRCVVCGLLKQQHIIAPGRMRLEAEEAE